MLLLFLLSFLRRWSVRSSLLGPLDCPKLGNLRLAKDGFNEADNRGVLGDVGIVQEPVGCAQNCGSDMDVRKGKTFTNKESPRFEDFLEGVECPLKTGNVVYM